MKLRTLFVLFAAIATTTQGAAFLDSQPAASQLGQAAFGIEDGIPSQPNRLYYPGGVCVNPVSGTVFVADTLNNRILRYSSATAALGGANGQPATADAVIGQLNDTSNSDALFLQPCGIWIDDGQRLWVADLGHNRVLRFDNADSLSGMAAPTVILGQPDDMVFNGGNSQVKCSAPRDVHIGADGTLWVADSGNHRVLRFANAAAKQTGSPADGQLGQEGWGLSAPSSSKNGMSSPYSVWAEGTPQGTRLWVAVAGQGRAVRYEDATTKADADGAPADGTQGESFSGYNPLLDKAHVMAGNSGLCVDAWGTLWVTDTQRNRVLGFANAGSLPDLSPATVVLGQPDEFTASTGTSALKMNTPYEVSPGLDGELFVVDGKNHRVLRFVPGESTPEPSPAPAAIAAPQIVILGKKKLVTTKASVRVRGTVTGAFYAVRLMNGKHGERVTVSGTTWRAKVKLRWRKNKITARAHGTGGVSAPATIIVIRKARANTRNP